MEVLLSSITASLAELRKPSKLIAKAGNQPVAVLHRNQAIGYFVPKSAVCETELISASTAQLDGFIKDEIGKIDHVLEYLKAKE